MSDTQTDPGGALVALCSGPRCAAVLGLAAPRDLWSRLRRLVAETPGAVLMSTGCLGRCDAAAAVALGVRAPGDAGGRCEVLVGGVEDPAQFARVQEWVREPPACRRPPDP